MIGFDHRQVSFIRFSARAPGKSASVSRQWRELGDQGLRQPRAALDTARGYVQEVASRPGASSGYIPREDGIGLRPGSSGTR